MQFFLRLIIIILSGALATELPLLAADLRPSPKPVPLMQAIPLPHHEISFQRDGRELTRYHYAPNLIRPFLYPVIGPEGRSLTRMGHPHDPESHSHHNSIWISHHDVNGVDFWGDRGQNPGRIVHQRINRFEDGEDEALVEVVNHWQATNEVLLIERRRITVRALPKDEWLLILDLQFTPAKHPVTLGKTPFGFMGVRMAKTIGVHDGGGTIRNSEGAVNEEEVFWKRARWVDYAGLIAPATTEGLTVFDHPANSNHPSVYHVRNDGWMGPSLNFATPLTLDPENKMHLRYGIYVHAGPCRPAKWDALWKQFAETDPVVFPDKP